MPLGIRIHDVRGRHPPEPIALIVADRLRPGADSAGRVPGSRPPAGTVRGIAVASCRGDAERARRAPRLVGIMKTR